MDHRTRVAVHRVAIIEGEAFGVAEGLDAEGVTTIFRDEALNLEPIVSRLEAGHEVIVNVPAGAILARSLPPPGRRTEETARVDPDVAGMPHAAAKRPAPSARKAPAPGQ